MEFTTLWIPDPSTEKLHYRYTSSFTSCGYFDADGDWIRSSSEISVSIELETFLEVKKTPKGAWIHGERSGEKFVLDYGRKRYAWPTKELAWESFIARKRKQIRLLSVQIAAAEAAIKAGPPEESKTHKTFHCYAITNNKVTIE